MQEPPHHPFPLSAAVLAKAGNLLLRLLQNLLMLFANSNKGGQPRERMGGQFAGYIPANRAERFREADRR